jgi:N,N'-diacetyllegionaminate synthase
VRTLAVILGRAGSKGVPGKNVRAVAGRPCIAWTIDAVVSAKSAGAVSHAVVSTDGADISAVAAAMGIEVIQRPPALATDTARVDDAARHALEVAERAHGQFDAVVILYANVPVRHRGLIERAAELLQRTNADSVQSYSPVGKHHPWWTAVVDEHSGLVRPWQGDVLNHGVFRRQDLPPAHIPDGGVLAVRREALMLEISGVPKGPHAFFGADRRGIVNAEGSVIDIDSESDLLAAEIALSGGTGGKAAQANRQLVIGERVIDEAHPPYIIAEIGVNHDGDPARALSLVDAAADAGADAVKFQLFRADLLMSRAAKLAAYQKAAGEHDPVEMLRRLELGVDQLRAPAARAKARGVHAIVTVFSEPLVAQAQSIAWDAFKTASPDLVNTPLLKALRATGKPMILSTGAATLDEVRGAVTWMGQTDADKEEPAPFALLQCVSSYPCPERDASLAAIRNLAALGGFPVGYSDHTPGTDTGALAVAVGACILEKHLTWSNAARGPDHAASLEPGAMKEYVRLARRAWEMLGRGGKRLLEVEHEVRRVSRQSIVATRPLRAGEQLSSDMLCCKRPGTGVPAAAFDSLIGRVLARDIEEDTPLTTEDLA